MGDILSFNKNKAPSQDELKVFILNNKLVDVCKGYSEEVVATACLGLILSLVGNNPKLKEPFLKLIGGVNDTN